MKQCVAFRHRCTLHESINGVIVGEELGISSPDRCTTSQRSKSGGEIGSRELAVQINSTWLRSTGTFR